MRDDEEDDDDEMMMEAVEITGQAASNAEPGSQGGGFLPEPVEGGGFMPVDDDVGGGFLPDPATAPTESSAGGFLLPDTAFDAPSGGGGGGGFLPEPTEGGGFFPEGGDAGGGFLPVPDSITAAEANQMQQDLDFASAGGFLPLPDVPASFNTESNDDNLLPLPDPNAPPPPDRIALTAIPTALRSLGLHRVGLQGAELMALFEEVASDDEEAEGGKSVQRDRFREACQVLLGSDDEKEDDDERDEYRDEPVDDEDLQGAGRRRLRRGAALKAEKPTRVQPTRRATRAHPIPNEEEGPAPSTTEEGAALEALPDDFEEDDDEGSPFASGSDGEEEDEDDGPSPKGGQSGSKTAPKQQKKGKRGRRAIDPTQPLSPRDIAAASDTFDLFFEESPQLAFPQKERNISLLELQRACRVLKEKMTDGDVSPRSVLAAFDSLHTDRLLLCS